MRTTREMLDLMAGAEWVRVAELPDADVLVDPGFCWLVGGAGAFLASDLAFEFLGGDSVAILRGLVLYVNPGMEYETRYFLRPGGNFVLDPATSRWAR